MVLQTASMGILLLQYPFSVPLRPQALTTSLLAISPTMHPQMYQLLLQHTVTEPNQRKGRPESTNHFRGPVSFGRALITKIYRTNIFHTIGQSLFIMFVLNPHFLSTKSPGHIAKNFVLGRALILK